DSESSALEAGEACVEALKELDGVITSFDICSAGSKPETKFPEIGPTTNHYFCPTLKGKIPDSKVPEGVRSIPEIVINGVSLATVKKAMFVCLDVASRIEGVLKLSAGNYGGRLGQHKIYLKEILQEFR
ncbi:MAG: formylmethanofuran--tetrahydromethanopterin N-formyltransferase, partial [Archaeoglobaceae archaeon]|nr:formylmethanofuran--tetrahydromethanopterin N-formyltransferase [Archaeoglobaceae archaeon]